MRARARVCVYVYVWVHVGVFFLSLYFRMLHTSHNRARAQTTRGQLRGCLLRLRLGLLVLVWFCFFG